MWNVQPVSKQITFLKIDSHTFQCGCFIMSRNTTLSEFGRNERQGGYQYGDNNVSYVLRRIYNCPVKLGCSVGSLPELQLRGITCPAYGSMKLYRFETKIGSDEQIPIHQSQFFHTALVQKHMELKQLFFVNSGSINA